MKKLLIAMLLLATVGCTGRYQHQLDQSLLLQENQRLEEALYVTHAQLVDLKRENEALKSLQTVGTGRAVKATAPLLPTRRSPSHDDYDEAPPYQAPKVTIPDDAPASDTLPDSLKSRIPSRVMPPNRQYALQKDVTTTQPEMIFPVLPAGEEDAGELVPPAWSPTR